jgi:hypothetical protein
MKPLLRRPSFLLALVGITSLAGTALAATYLPLSDEELARRSPVIVRARVLAQETRLETRDGGDMAVTVTRFQPLEVIKGRIASETFQIELPGGVAADVATWVPGTPSFAALAEVVLFLSPSERDDDVFSLTEFGLSKFDVVEDRAHRRFAVRTVFSPGEDDFLALREETAGATGGGPRPLRDADSFAASLAGAVAEGALAPVVYAAPEGELQGPRGASPLWVNIGGSEGSGGLYRWFWDTGRSSPAIVSAKGTQTGLSDGSDGLSSVENAVTQWSAVPGATVRYSLSFGSAPVVVNLDVESKSPYWTTPLSCSSGGVIGVSGPGSVSSAGSFKGDAGYYAIATASVSMRKVTGGCYSWRIFRTAVLHELGHTLGLGHPDQAASLHATTAPADRASAAMASSVPPSQPSAPQADDIQAILWYYGSDSGTPPSAGFRMSSGTVDAGQSIAFSDTSTGAPTSWSWNFGDGATSTLRNPAHVYASAGTFTVSLTASNGFGSSQRGQTVTVLPARLRPSPASRPSPGRLVVPVRQR